MCHNEELTVKIYATNTQNNILQTSTFTDNTGDYGTNGEIYIARALTDLGCGSFESLSDNGRKRSPPPHNAQTSTNRTIF